MNKRLDEEGRRGGVNLLKTSEAKMEIHLGSLELYHCLVSLVALVMASVVDAYWRIE